MLYTAFHASAQSEKKVRYRIHSEKEASASAVPAGMGYEHPVSLFIGKRSYTQEPFGR